MSDNDLKKLMAEWGIFPMPGQAYEANILGFAKAVETIEREACAKVCEDWGRDAERYRWLRDHCTPEEHPEHTWIVEAPGDQWDTEIDTAMEMAAMAHNDNVTGAPTHGA